MRRNPVLDQLGAYAMTELQALAREMRATGRQVIDFSIGDPREPTPAFIPEALRRAVPEVSQYPTVRGLPELRGAVADYVARRFGVAVDPETQVVPTSGSKEAIFSTPLAFVSPGDAVVYGTPGYPIYERGTLFAGAEAAGIRLSGDFVLRAGDIPDDLWRRTRLVWLCTPHNPTGSVTGLSDLEDLVAAAREHDVLLLSDECYADLYEGDPPPSVLEAAGEGSSGVLSYLSLSKRSGMTGYRSGAFIGDPEAVAALAQLRASVGVASAEFVQAAAVEAWSDDDHAAERRAIFARKRAILAEAFEAMGFEVAGSEAGIYLWVVVDDDAAMAEKLLADGIVVSPGSSFGPGGEGHLRLALVPTVSECAEAMEVLQRCLKS
jgi:succinyldiaminopimelate transaminase